MTDSVFNFFDLIFDVLPTMVNTMIEAKKVIDDAHKEQRAELRKSNITYDSDISRELMSEVSRMSNGNTLINIDFIKKANKTQKWINYALYYMTHEDAVKIMASKSEKMLVNAVSTMAGFGKIYDDEGILNISKCDAKSLDVRYYGDFILLADEVWDKVSNITFQDKMKVRMINTGMVIEPLKIEGNTDNMPKFNSVIDDDGYIHPIFFQNEALTYQAKPVKGAGISDELYCRLEDAFAGLLTNYTYRYECVDGVYYLYILRPDAMNAEDWYIVDDGKLLGGSKISILARYIKPNGEHDTQFVDVKKHRDIVSSMLQSSFKPLSEAEVISSVTDYFNNTIIYHNIDFSNTSFMDTYNQKDMYDLEVSLLGVLQVLDSDVRLRFCGYNNPTNFTLISDENVSSTLAETSHNIANGLVIKVTDNSITKTYGGHTKTYSMKK